MSAISVTYTFTNGTVSDGPQVSQNFSDLISGLSDGTKDLSMNAGTFAGNVNINGNTTIGNATSDDLTITAGLESSITIGTNASYDIGSTSAALRALYLDNGATDAGAIYFNLSTSTYIKSNAAGTQLDLAGFTTYAFTGAVTVSTTVTVTGQTLHSDGTASAPGLSFSSDTNTGIYRIGADNVGFATAGTAVGDISSAGLWTFGASGGTQTHVVNGALSVIRGQIVFPATQVASSNANTLDDYEEGTWTPSDQSGAALSLTTTIATYIKIGRMVFIQAALSYPSTADGSNASIGGFPFTSTNDATRCASITVSETSCATNPLYWVVNINDTRMIAGTASGAAVANSALSSKYLRFSGWYMAAS